MKYRYYLLFIVHMIIITFESSLALLKGELFAFSGRFMWRFSGLCTLDFGTKMNFNPTFFSRKRANQAKLPSAIFTDVSLLKVYHITFLSIFKGVLKHLRIICLHFRIYRFHLGKWIILTPCMSDHRTGISSFSQERKFHILA